MRIDITFTDLDDEDINLLHEAIKNQKRFYGYNAEGEGLQKERRLMWLLGDLEEQAQEGGVKICD